MKKIYADDTFDQSELKALAGPNSAKFIKKMFDKATEPDLSAMLTILRGACRKRAASIKASAYYLLDDEKDWLAQMLNELQAAQREINALMDSSPPMAKPEDVLKAKRQFLRNKFKWNQLGGR